MHTAVLRLAQAVQRFNTYPLGSPLSHEAVRGAHRAICGLSSDTVLLRVTQRMLLLDEAPLSTLPAISDLAARLHHASIGSLDLSRTASERDITVFCRELVRRDEGLAPLPDRLRECGVDKLALTRFERPAVLEVPLALPLAEPRAREAAPRGESGGYLYPPGKGWVRIDPVNASVSHITLTDLAQFVRDPFTLASMLVSLSEDAAPRDPADALAMKFEDVANLFRASDPIVAEGLLAGLARAVLALEPERRLSLLRESILPGLIEGRFDGTVLRHLPDLELAETLALLAEMKLAAPELVVLALDRLELPEERRRRIEPMVEERLAGSDEGAAQAPGAIDGYADGRIRVDLSRVKEFRDFASFDLALDDQTELAWAAIRRAVAESDLPAERIECQIKLLVLDPNPDVSGWLLASVGTALLELRQAGAWATVVRLVARLRELQESLTTDRDEVAERIESTLRTVADSSYVAEILRLIEEDAADPTASQLVAAPGRAIVPAVVATLERGVTRACASALVKVVSAHALTLAPAFAEYLAHPSTAVLRDLVTIVGHGGAGAEGLVAPLLDHHDETVVREAYRALVRIGTPAAHLIVVERLRTTRGAARLAEEAFWRFPADLAGPQAVQLLADESFVARHPRVAHQLLTRSGAHHVERLRPVLPQLARLRWRLWRPAHVRVGFAAARLEGQDR